jgi:DNA recombination protein RmuC
LAENSRLIVQTGRELYERLGTFTDHFRKVGGNLKRSVESYNQAVGSLDTRVLPSTRKLKELHATTDKALEVPEVVEVLPREPREIVEAACDDTPPGEVA